jgi:hypothetical protein
MLIYVHEVICDFPNQSILTHANVVFVGAECVLAHEMVVFE